jgi:hypothetical protein
MHASTMPCYRDRYSVLVCVSGPRSAVLLGGQRIEIVADVGYASCQNSLLDQVIQ